MPETSNQIAECIESFIIGNVCFVCNLDDKINIIPGRLKSTRKIMMNVIEMHVFNELSVLCNY